VAEQADSAATMTIHDAFMRDFVRKFLVLDNPDLSPEGALAALTQMNDSTSVSHTHVLYASQLFFRYLLLDVCADAYNLPASTSNRILTHSQRPSWGVDKMYKVQ
jgi:hypothetical protein